MARKDQAQFETLRLWHCPECGYANVGMDPCLGCHKRAPRRIRSNTKEYLRTRAGSPRQQ
jgi:rubrerythrin